MDQPHAGRRPCRASGRHAHRHSAPARRFAAHGASPSVGQRQAAHKRRTDRNSDRSAAAARLSAYRLLGGRRPTARLERVAAALRAQYRRGHLHFSRVVARRVARRAQRLVQHAAGLRRPCVGAFRHLFFGALASGREVSVGQVAHHRPHLPVLRLHPLDRLYSRLPYRGLGSFFSRGRALGRPHSQSAGPAVRVGLLDRHSGQAALCHDCGRPAPYACGLRRLSHRPGRPADRLCACAAPRHELRLSRSRSAFLARCSRSPHPFLWPMWCWCSVRWTSASWCAWARAMP